MHRLYKRKRAERISAYANAGYRFFGESAGKPGVGKTSGGTTNGIRQRSHFERVVRRPGMERHRRRYAIGLGISGGARHEYCVYTSVGIHGKGHTQA